MSYEDSVKKVESIISELSSGKLPLDKAAEAFGQGMAELENCRKALENAKMSVREAGAENKDE